MDEWVAHVPEDRYDAICRAFRWDLPETFNVGVEICDRHADDPDRLALIYEAEGGRPESYTFARLKELSNRFGNALAALGIERGDRVAINLSQRPETLIGHIAVYKIGAVVLPLSTQFGPDALRHRLADSGAKAVIVDGENVAKILGIRDTLPELRHVIVVEPEDDAGDQAFETLLDRAASDLTPVATGFREPAFLLYTSGTTGPAKGALHGPCHIYAHQPGIAFIHHPFPSPDDRFWTPNDWAWGGALVVAIYPSLLAGVPVIAHRFRRFDPEAALDLMSRHRVRNTVLPPTALKMMRQLDRPRESWTLDVRTVGSGGEPVGAELIEWGREAFGLTITEFYGLTEMSLLCGNSATLYPARPGSLGRAIPGRTTEVVSPDGEVLPPGTQGIIAGRAPDPILFLGYWNNPEATRTRYAGDWFLTGDVATKDDEGYFWFDGRDDDIISSGAYRIGPSDIEDCIFKHPAVAMVAVVGSPDPVRGEIVKAFVVAKRGVEAGADVVADIQQHVRSRLAAYQYPREIEFVDSLPLTTTGKIRRNELRDAERKRKAGMDQGAVP